MKNLTIALFVLIATMAVTTNGQVKSVTSANNQPGSKTTMPTQNPAKATRVRILGQYPKVAAPGGSTIGNIATSTLQSRAKSDFNNDTQAVASRLGSISFDKSFPDISTLAVESGTASNVGAASAKSVGADTSLMAAAANTNSPIAAVATQMYRVGINDVLDIQLADNPTKDSTLFTVLEGGLLEYPLAGDPIAAAGLTTPEIAGLLRQRLRVFDNPVVVVNVRDYASHTANITGFVAAPGTKTLRREAVPLYAVLAEALTLPEAARATITRPGRTPFVVDLKDPNQTSILVVSGDAIKVSGMPAVTSEFFFIGGEINSPGQKAYHAGITLTQAILASGGTNKSAGSKVRVSRPGTDGRLINEDYNLRKIQSGKIPDPVLQKGDRIEVRQAH